jgi:general L-amino acid transport system permease protein
MFQGKVNTAATLLVGALACYLIFKFLGWAVWHAIWHVPAEGSTRPCVADETAGACWAVVNERARFIFFGAYPFEEQWRPALACLLFITLYGLSAVRAFWKVWPGIWAVILLAVGLLMGGGVFGLSDVPTDMWGGLPLTFILSTVGFAVAFPMAILLAVGRRSTMPAIRTLCITYIELIRGVPFITFLFMAAVMFPLFVPQGFTVDKLVRAQIALILVIAAYLAEVIRAGFESVPKGQFEAAASMGLSFWRATFLVTLPQALRAMIPSLVNTFIAFFKDTSLVAIIGLFDLLGAAKAVIADEKWSSASVEVYLFVAAIYFVFCYIVSRYSQSLEARLKLRSNR